MRVSDHVQVETLFAIHLEETSVLHFVDSLVIKVALDIGWPSQKKLQDNKESSNRVSVELKSFVVVIPTGTGTSESFTHQIHFLLKLFTRPTNTHCLFWLLL